MPKSPNQKLKLLYLLKILEEESDEAHPLGISELAAALQRHGIAAERKSLYDDMELLALFGYDVIQTRGRRNTYYLGQRRFEGPEMKLLVDAVQSAKFITEGKSRTLIHKICALASRHEAARLGRQVYVAGRAKTFNERTFYSVDAIQTAMGQNRQISFQYFEWAIDPAAPRLFTRRWRRGGGRYIASPWGLLWDDEYYYLLAYDAESGIIKHYRVDKMDALQTEDTPRAGREVFEALDTAHFSQSVFGMFGGQETDVRLCFTNRLIGVVVDRFGRDIIVHRHGDAHFTLTVRVVVSPQFLAWLYGFGGEARVLAPSALVRQVRAGIRALADVYNED